MTLFEYLSVFLPVIMGLGVTHILSGLSKTIHYRRTLGLSWVHTMWAINILIYIVIIWWGMFWWSKQSDWSFFDFGVHFEETRAWFFGVLSTVEQGIRRR